jgi:hypothetical protein
MYSGMKLCLFRAVPLSIIRSLFTVYKPVWHIPVPSVQWINSWWWAEELHETCRVSCRSKFGKLVHLVGFVIKAFVTMHVTSHESKIPEFIILIFTEKTITDIKILFRYFGNISLGYWEYVGDKLRSLNWCRSLFSMPDISKTKVDAHTHTHTHTRTHARIFCVALHERKI